VMNTTEKESSPMIGGLQWCDPAWREEEVADDDET
jgi:hypothetical protein